MRVRFQADADLNEDILAATLRREPRVDFRSAGAAGLHGLSDPEVLAHAAADGRVVVDSRTMPGHFATFTETADSPGVLIVSQRLAVATIAADLVLIWEASAPEDWRNVLLYLPL
jgi:hypothetical protein